MDSRKFDDIAKTFASGASRRRVLKGILAAAAGAVGLRRAGALKAAPTCRALGEACRDTSSCCPGTHLICENVGETGARRCECDLGAGFVECNGQCVFGACCPSGQQFCNGQCVSTTCTGGTVFNQSTCACACPNGTNTCPSTGACVPACTGGKVFNSSTCLCECPINTTECNGVCVNNQCAGGQVFSCATGCACPNGGVFCNGCCHDPATACAGLHNQNFNANCCSCENPGQPSGRCKNPPLACPA